MGLIKINNENYGTFNASDIAYKSIAIEEKLDIILIFDLNDNINIENAKYNYLAYGYIVNSLIF